MPALLLPVVLPTFSLQTQSETRLPSAVLIPTALPADAILPIAVHLSTIESVPTTMPFALLPVLLLAWQSSTRDNVCSKMPPFRFPFALIWCTYTDWEPVSPRIPLNQPVTAPLRISICDWFAPMTSPMLELAA